MRDLERLGADVLAGVLPRIYPQVLELAYRHQDDGRRVYIVTAASQELAEHAGPRARLRRRDRLAVLRGRRRRLHRSSDRACSSTASDKARAIEQLAEREGIDLCGSYAYSDSASDLPMLRVVGHPVAVNPDATLAKAAREDGWEVLRFDRLGRRLKAAVGLAGAAVAGGVGSAAVAAHNRRRRGLVAKLR